MPIHFILTGGTIDSLYNPKSETAEPATQSCVPDYINRMIHPHDTVTCETVCMLDSGDIDDALRQTILDRVLACPHDHIIIVHGTNTMTTTQDFLSGKTRDKVVVLTGAMVPLKEFAMSDGGFNLGYACAEVKNLSSGVYLCMNATTFKVGTVRKNFAEGLFEPL
ncbi:MAG: asparaginase domain-containing protein [Pseudobdellovibrionaceae bacterium]